MGLTETIAASIGEIFGILIWIGIIYYVYRYFKRKKQIRGK